MTQQLATDVSLRSREAPPRNGAAIAHAAGALLAELECSLEVSQRALLCHDLEGLERATCEQIGLRRSLEILESEHRASDGAAPQIDPEIDPGVTAGLRAARWRVLYLGRVQAALLRRAQRSLRIVSHRLAGPEASYAAPVYSASALAPPAGSAVERGRKEGSKTEPTAHPQQHPAQHPEHREEPGPCRV
jgi:hypothetical protein